VTDPIVSLDVDRVAVEPGGQVSVTIKITNPGTIVEGYRVEVIGEGVSDWGEALPPEISIYPQPTCSNAWPRRAPARPTPTETDSSTASR